MRHKELNVVKSATFNLEITNHSLLAMVMEYSGGSNSSISKLSFEQFYKIINLNLLKQYLQEVNWNSVLNKLSIINSLFEFYKII